MGQIEKNCYFFTDEINNIEYVFGGIQTVNYQENSMNCWIFCSSTL